MGWLIAIAAMIGLLNPVIDAASAAVKSPSVEDVFPFVDGLMTVAKVLGNVLATLFVAFTGFAVWRIVIRPPLCRRLMKLRRRRKASRLRTAPQLILVTRD